MSIKGFQLDVSILELNDVDASGSPSIATGDALIYNSVTQQFEHQATPIFAGLDALPDVTLTTHGSPAVHLEKEILSYDAGINQWVDRLIPEAGLLACSTGLMMGGEVQFGTQNGSPLLGSPQVTTTVTVSAGQGVVVNSYTDPTNPSYSNVSWSEFTDVTLTSLASADITYFAINSSGTLLQQTANFTAEEHRDVVKIGAAVHSNRTNVVAISNNPHAAFDPNVRLGDLAEAIGAFNITGNVYEPNGANLNLDKTVGESYRLGNNFHTTKKSPDITQDAIVSALSFNYSYQDGSGGYTLDTSRILIDGGSWDDGDGTLGSVPSNDWTVQVIKHFPGVAVTRIEYGQTIYGTAAAAIAAIPDVNHIHNPAFSEGIVRSYLVVRGGASNLSTTADAQFIEAGRFGASGAAGSTGSGVFTSTFESTPFTITASTDHTAVHGLGVVPAGAQAFLRCVSSELGYTVDDEVEFMNYDGTTAYKGIHVDVSNIHWMAGPDIVVTVHAGSPGIGELAIITPAKWRIILRAYA